MPGRPTSPAPPATLAQDLIAFRWEGRPTAVRTTRALLPDGTVADVPTYVNEFWTSRQRAAHSLHEVSYRACFKPQLPRFFIDRLTSEGDAVYDPFMGRGTTPLEAALLGRVPAGCDASPLSRILLEPRLDPPAEGEVRERLADLDLRHAGEIRDDLLTFYHPETLRALTALREYLLARDRAGTLDRVDRWIRMVAVNRLTGHSPGFFSVYTLPPNQATSVVAQRKINAKRRQTPPPRDVAAVILRKTRALLAGCDLFTCATLSGTAGRARLLTRQADATPEIRSGSVRLVVTSPPFLNVVDYKGDNWLRCWFCGIDPGTVRLTVVQSLDSWQTAMTAVFRELHRVLAPGGHVAFEVGEVRGGTVRLEEAVIPCGAAAGLDPLLVLVNDQHFTKTANVWGVANNRLGTNTNRVVVFAKA